MKYLAYLNIFVISFIVFGGAGFVIKYSLPNNNIVLAENTYKYLAVALRPESSQAAVAGVSTSSQVEPTSSPSAQLASVGISQNNMLTCLDHLPETNSVINYLMQQNLPYSYLSRQVLSQKLGMNTYRGTAEDNAILLSLLRKAQTECQTL